MTGTRPWSVEDRGRRIGGVRAGPDAGRRALFVHGVPASSEKLRFLDLAGGAIAVAGVACVAIDRPGIGFSALYAVPPRDAPEGAAAAADDMAAELPPPDRALIDDPSASAAFGAMLRHGLRGGPTGSVIDGRTARGPWPLGERDVRYPVDVYGGDRDRNVPIGVARAWVERLDGARLVTMAGEGHVSVLPAVAERVLESVA